MIPLHVQDWPAPARPKHIVIIGAGGIVRTAHLPAYARAGLAVAAITDLDPARATALATEFGISQVHPTVAAAVAAHGTTVAYDIAVPPDAIMAVLTDLPDGAAVLIQKPMGANLDQARAIRALCRDKGLIAAVNFQLRFAPMMLAARHAITTGMIGDPLDIEVHLNIFTPWTLFPFLIPMPRVEMLVHSVHYLDTIRALFGTPQAAFARSLPDPRAPGFAQTRTSVILDYGDLRRGVLTINHNHQGGRRFQSAWLRAEGTGGCLMVKLGVCFDYPHGEADELWYCKSAGEWDQVPLTGSWFTEAFMGPMRNLQRVAAGEDTALFSGVEDAFATMALVEACYLSLARPAEPVSRD